MPHTVSANGIDIKILSLSPQVAAEIKYHGFISNYPMQYLKNSFLVDNCGYPFCISYANC
jgi:hypothetical protein